MWCPGGFEAQKDSTEKKRMLQKKASKSGAALSWDCHQTIKLANMITYELGEIREILEIIVECVL